MGGQGRREIFGLHAASAPAATMRAHHLANAGHRSFANQTERSRRGLEHRIAPRQAWIRAGRQTASQ